MWDSENVHQVEKKRGTCEESVVETKRKMLKKILIRKCPQFHAVKFPFFFFVSVFAQYLYGRNISSERPNKC